jgi:polysaccharide export outer membrane protein
MPAHWTLKATVSRCLLLVPLTLGGGCATTGPECTIVSSPLPHELKKVNLPPYTIEPPDILLLDAVSVIPKPPFRISPLDLLLIQATPAPVNEPIGGIYGVQSDGTVTLGPTLGTVRIAGMTLDEARAAIQKHLEQFLEKPKVAVALAQSRALQQIRGEHLVGPDGTVNLGVYGAVRVTGLTINEAKAAIEAHLSQHLLRPEVSISITGYNSKVYYVIFDGGGYGQQMVRLPITGNETVLDALSQINGLPAVASLRRIWVARPAPDELACEQILPVDWSAITDRGIPTTNYQLLPGDRIHVKADFLIALDNTLAKFLAPVERSFGVTLLGSQTVQSLQGKLNGSNGSGL